MGVQLDVARGKLPDPWRIQTGDDRNLDPAARFYSERGGIVWHDDWLRIQRRPDSQTRTNPHDPFHRS